MPPIMGAGGFINGGAHRRTLLHHHAGLLFPALMYFFSVFVMVHYEAKRHRIHGKGPGDGSGSDPQTGLVLPPAPGGHHRPDAHGLLAGLRRGAGALGLHRGELAPQGHPHGSTRVRGGRPGRNRQQPHHRRHRGGSLASSSACSPTAVWCSPSPTSSSRWPTAGSGWPSCSSPWRRWSWHGGAGDRAYLVTAVVAVPPLTALGVNPIAAHMIVYWLSQDSNITPPVCIAAFHRRRHRQSRHVEDRLHRSPVRQVPLPGALHLRLRAGLLPGRQRVPTSWSPSRSSAAGVWTYAWLLSGIWLGWFGGSRNPEESRQAG